MRELPIGLHSEYSIHVLSVGQSCMKPSKVLGRKPRDLLRAEVNNLKVVMAKVFILIRPFAV